MRWAHANPLVNARRSMRNALVMTAATFYWKTISATRNGIRLCVCERTLTATHYSAFTGYQISAFMATATWVTFYGATRYRTLLTDDCMMGPPIQDLWMLLSGERHDQTGQLATILDAYNDFYPFDVARLILSNRCAPCASCTMRHGSRSAGTTKHFHQPFQPSIASITGLNTF